MDKDSALLIQDISDLKYIISSALSSYAYTNNNNTVMSLVNIHSTDELVAMIMRELLFEIHCLNDSSHDHRVNDFQRIYKYVIFNSGFDIVGIVYRTIQAPLLYGSAEIRVRVSGTLLYISYKNNNPLNILTNFHR